MMFAVWKQYPTAHVTYQFINRRPLDRFNPEFELALRSEIDALGDLSLTSSEQNWLKAKGYFPDSFIDFLHSFRLRPDQVSLALRDGQLEIEIAGLWYETILWEVPLMARLSETYFRTIDTEWDHNLEHYREKTLRKGIRLSEAKCLFSDFGTRRRRSYGAHKCAIEAFMDIDQHGVKSTFLGTSNVHFAHCYDLEPIGTMAHEWIMGHADGDGVDGANARALEAWLKVYGNRFLIALTDTFTTDLFLKEFSQEMAEIFQGVRHDSGSAKTFVDKMEAFYRRCGIDPRSKKVVFSDGLDVDKAIAVQRYTEDKLQPLFGIGTHFTNDFNGSRALNIVIKLHSMNGKPVVKISDIEGKASGDPNAVTKTMIKIRKAMNP